MSASQRRYNPLLDEWVLCSPGRLSRPWQGEREPAPEQAPLAYDPSCYLCPGNARASGARNPEYRGVFLFDNDYPALTGDRASAGGTPHPLFLEEPESGRCRVISFSERHDRHLGSLNAAEVERVIDAWASESERLAVEMKAASTRLLAQMPLPNTSPAVRYQSVSKSSAAAPATKATAASAAGAPGRVTRRTRPRSRASPIGEARARDSTREAHARNSISSIRLPSGSRP